MLVKIESMKDKYHPVCKRQEVLNILRWVERRSKVLNSHLLRVFVGGGREGWDFVRLLFGSCCGGTQTGMPCVITVDLDVHQWPVL